MTTTTRRPLTTSSAIFQWRSLKTRVTIFTLAIFLVGIWSLAFYASYTLQKDTEQSLGEQQFSVVSIMATDINTALDDRLRALEKVAAGITPTILGNAASMQKILEERPVLEIMFNAGTNVTRLDGVVIADVPISTGRIGINYSDRNHVAGALKGKATIGNPVMGKMLKAPIVPIAVPILDKGKVIGTLTGITNLGAPNFLSKITDNSYGKTGGYLLVSRQIRTIVYATDKKRIMEVLPTIGINPLIDRFIQGNEGSGVAVNPLGVEVLASAKGIPLSGWYVVAMMPTEEAFAPVHAMQKRMMLATIFLTLLAGGLIWWMLKRQLTPIFTTIKTLATMSNIDQPSQPLPITRQDEIGELIGGFNHLLETVGQREEALRKSNELFSLFMRHSPIYTFIKEVNPTQSIVLQASDNYAQMVGLSGADMIGKTMAELFAPEFAAKITADDWAVVSGGEVLRLEEELNGRSYTTIKFPIVRGDKTLLAGYTVDITQRKQAEAEKAQLEIQLLQTHKMEAIGTLAGGIAHDFNNILAAMIGYTELSLVEDQKEIQHQYLQETLKGAERAKDLIKQILTFSRQDSREKKPQDMKLLLKEAVKFLRASMPATIEFRQHLTNEPCNILADYTQVYQVIMNLCTNASHAMKQAGGILTIELATLDLAKSEILHHPGLKPGPYVKLTVSDTGCGIDSALITRIFDPFFTTKSKEEGTGLGLSVAYGIVKSHDGVINVYSELGKGSSFSVYLPRIIHAAVTIGSISETVIGGTEQILFVDDEPALVDIGMLTLSSLGYQVTGVMSSNEALELFRAEPQRFDLVITDMTLPKMTGIELSREILQIRPDMPVILCSGLRDSETEEQVKSLGIRAYCTKPLAKKDLSRVVRETLDGQESSRM